MLALKRSSQPEVITVCLKFADIIKYSFLGCQKRRSRNSRKPIKVLILFISGTARTFCSTLTWKERLIEDPVTLLNVCDGVFYENT